MKKDAFISSILGEDDPLGHCRGRSSYGCYMNQRTAGRSPNNDSSGLPNRYSPPNLPRSGTSSPLSMGPAGFSKAFRANSPEPAADCQYSDDTNSSLDDSIEEDLGLYHDLLAPETKRKTIFSYIFAFLKSNDDENDLDTEDALRMKHLRAQRLLKAKHIFRYALLFINFSFVVASLLMIMAGIIISESSGFSICQHCHQLMLVSTSFGIIFWIFALFGFIWIRGRSILFLLLFIGFIFVLSLVLIIELIVAGLFAAFDESFTSSTNTNINSLNLPGQRSLSAALPNDERRLLGQSAGDPSNEALENKTLIPAVVGGLFALLEGAFSTKIAANNSLTSESNPAAGHPSLEFSLDDDMTVWKRMVEGRDMKLCNFQMKNNCSGYTYGCCNPWLCWNNHRDDSLQTADEKKQSNLDDGMTGNITRTRSFTPTISAPKPPPWAKDVCPTCPDVPHSNETCNKAVHSIVHRGLGGFLIITVLSLLIVVSSGLLAAMARSLKTGTEY